MNPLPYLLLTIVVTSTLLFGAVEPWSIAIVGILTALMFCLFVLSFPGFTPEDRSSRRIAFACFLLFAYGLFQLIPLPVSFLKLLHPPLAEILALPAISSDSSVSATTAYSLLPTVLPVFHSVSLYPFVTELGLAKITIYLMVFAIAAFGFDDREDIYFVLKVLAIFCFIVGVFAIIQKGLWNGKIYWFRELTQGGIPFGPFVNRNHFAGWIGMVVPLSLGIGLMSRRGDKRIRYSFLGLIMAVALFFSLSRGGIISFLVGMGVFAFIAFRNTLSKRRLFPLFLFVLVLAGYLVYLGVSPIIERFAGTEPSNEQRLVVWVASLAAAKGFPVLGSGVGTYQYLFKMYQPESVQLFYDHAHNDYIEFLIETGVIGLALAALFAYLIFKTIRSADWTRREAYLKAGFYASIVSMAVHSFFDFNLHIPSNAILFSLILGLAVSLSRLNRDYEGTEVNEQISK
jgi:O-antigen ligase